MAGQQRPKALRDVVEQSIKERTLFLAQVWQDSHGPRCQPRAESVIVEGFLHRDPTHPDIGNMIAFPKALLKLPRRARRHIGVANPRDYLGEAVDPSATPLFPLLGST
ncbi:MAG: hypothetical protein AB7N65_02760 [Vicinamibacterales bacterium]